MVRAFQDGPYVVTQAKRKRSGKEIFFDIFSNVGMAWLSNTGLSPLGMLRPTRAGTPRPMGRHAKHLEDTEKNKSLLRENYETFHFRGDHSGSERYLPETS